MNSNRYSYVAAEKGIHRWSKPDHSLVPHVGLMATPNANGELHIGHAYVSLSEDVWARLNQLRGRDSHIITGADHGGHSLVRVANQEYFADTLSTLEKCCRIFEVYRPMIFATLHQLRTQFVLEQERSSIDDRHRQQVAQVFVDLAEKQYIIRARVPTNWCPQCRMIVPYVEARSSFTRAHRYTVTLYGEYGEEVLFQMEEPEMILAQPFAVVHQGITSTRFRHPLRPNEWIPAISTADVARLQVGFLYWPESNLEAYQTAKRNGWEMVGSGLYSVDERLSARSAALAALKDAGVGVRVDMENVRVYRCQCDTKLETLPLEQWVLDLAKVRADLHTQFVMDKVVPDSVQAEWADKVEHYVGDWTLSRQSVWGIHPPAYRCTRCQSWQVTLQMPDVCPRCHGPVVQDSDVIDVWFVSNIGKITWGQDARRIQCDEILSSISLGSDTFGLALVRTEILAQLLTGKSLSERIAVLPLLVDEWGRKLSKSQGNARPVNEYLEEWGTDIFRLALLRAPAVKGKVIFGPYLFIHSRNFVQKLWSLKNFFLVSSTQLLVDGPMDETDVLLWRLLRREIDRAQEVMYEAIRRVNFREAVQKLEEVTRKYFSDVIVPYLRLRREKGMLSTCVLHSFRTLYLQWVCTVWAFAPDIALRIFEELDEIVENFALFIQRETEGVQEEAQETDSLSLQTLNTLLNKSRTSRTSLLPAEWTRRWPGLLTLFEYAVQT